MTSTATIASTSKNVADIIVIGAGIAGASVAAELAKKQRVILVEMESQPGYHTTGRSAAMFVPSYGPAPIRALTRASAAFFNNPDKDFKIKSLLSSRPVMMIAREDQLEAMHILKSEISQNTIIRDLSSVEISRMNPLLKENYATAGLLDVEAYDIDVDALHQGYLQRFKDRGGELRTNFQIDHLVKNSGCWEVSAAGKQLKSPIVVNASGAWADELTDLAGFQRVGLTPKRRTMVVIDSPEGTATATLPMTIDIEEQFFLKPEAGQLLLSPADETPSPPCDAQPEELDIAIGVDRIESAFDFSVRRIQSSWAGLRSFVTDKVPAVGFLDKDESFFLLAGQGGYGIQSSPALSRMAAALATGEPMPGDIADEGVTPQQLSPKRLICS
ncbi:MAG: FAD-dependent oxidoreductase [Rhizobiaceae bacterium]|nr:FAD-dependent oxidoreductase [Rhizobiaceae bacterium]